MYKKEQRFIRTCNEIFERKKHYKDYRVVNGVLVQFAEVEGEDRQVYIGSDAIVDQAETLVGAIKIGDYIKVYGYGETLFKVAEKDDMFVSTETGCRYKSKEILAVYAPTYKGLKLIYEHSSYSK